MRLRPRCAGDPLPRPLLLFDGALLLLLLLLLSLLSLLPEENAAGDVNRVVDMRSTRGETEAPAVTADDDDDDEDADRHVCCAFARDNRLATGTAGDADADLQSAAVALCRCCSKPDWTSGMTMLATAFCCTGRSARNCRRKCEISGRAVSVVTIAGRASKLPCTKSCGWKLTWRGLPARVYSQMRPVCSLTQNWNRLKPTPGSDTAPLGAAPTPI